MRRAALMLAPAHVGSSSCFAMSWRVRRRPWWAAWLVVVVAGCLVALPTARVPANGHPLSSRVGSSLPVAAWGPVSRAVGRDDSTYRITRLGRVFVASDPGQLLREQFSSSAVSVGTGTVSLDVRVRGYGYGKALVMVPPRSPILSAGRIVYPTRQFNHVVRERAARARAGIHPHRAAAGSFDRDFHGWAGAVRQRARLSLGGSPRSHLRARWAGACISRLGRDRRKGPLVTRVADPPRAAVVDTRCCSRCAVPAPD